jgi:hypothetical protein
MLCSTRAHGPISHRNVTEVTRTRPFSLALFVCESNSSLTAPGVRTFHMHTGGKRAQPISCLLPRMSVTYTGARTRMSSPIRFHHNPTLSLPPLPHGSTHLHRAIVSLGKHRRTRVPHGQLAASHRSKTGREQRPK